MTEIIDFLARELERALASGQDIVQARQAAEVAVRTEYAGERVYIAGLPKQRRAVQLAALNTQATREIVAITGMSRQHVWRLKKFAR